MDDFFTSEEKKELFSLYRHLLQSAGEHPYGCLCACVRYLYGGALRQMARGVLA